MPEGFETESELISAVKDSDGSALRFLCQSYFERMYLFFWRRTRDAAASSLLVARLFRDLWMNRAALETSLDLRAHLYKAANDLTLGYLSKSGLQPGTSPGEQRDFGELLYLALQDLPETHRFTFMLSRYERLPFEQIAKITDTSETTVEAYLGNSVKYLRERLRHLLAA